MLKSMRFAVSIILAVGLIFSVGAGVDGKQAQVQPTSYSTVTEIFDWGAATTKVIIDLGRPVPKGSVEVDTFKVHVTRAETRGEILLGESEGYRNITNAYVADKKGNPAVAMGRYAVLEMEVGPTLGLSSPLNYGLGSGRNAWIDMDYAITQVKDIATNAGNISGLEVRTFTGEAKVLVDDFTFSSATYDDVTLSYAHYAPSKRKGNGKTPLIIWLHGGGEGGFDATIPLSANKAVNFASEEIQAYFGGAHVLVPQAPTMWMDGLTGVGDGTSKYTEAVMGLITDYVAQNKDIDQNRIYIGGCSNGGYMTLVMTRDYPGYFAAAFPVCGPLSNNITTDEHIKNMIQTPTWFISSKDDPVVRVESITVLYDRMKEKGDNVYITLFDDVRDTSGHYLEEDGTPYMYNGHWSWIYVYNNEVRSFIDGNEITLMEWMAAQSLK